MNKRQFIQRGIIAIMRISITQALIMVILTSLVSAANLRGQGVLDRKVSINVNDREIKAVLFEIEEKAFVTFTYRSGTIEPSKKVTLKLNGARLGDVLQQLFGPAIEPIVVEEKIVLKPVPPIDVENEGEAAVFIVTGKVSDEESLALPGVNILEKGTLNGTVSDADGNYVIKVSDGNATLVFSFVGYAGEEMPLNNRSVINVQLTPDISTLKEVVVVGYGTVDRRDLTGSVASVNSESIERINTTSLNNALQGLAAGVQVTASSGRPGESSNIIIRGGSSISASNEPLYVIDGIPQLGGDNMDLNPQNIESIDVLKDASAGAIYGARASNGVVIITTKSGSKGGKPTISYTGRVSFAEPIRKIETLNIVEFATVQNALNPADIAYANPAGYADSTSVNWQDEIFRTAATQMHDLQISGGTANSKYSASVGYVTQDGIAVGSDYSRINSRLRLESDLSSRLRTGVNISFSADKRSGPEMTGETGPGLYALRSRPYIQGGYSGDFADYQDPIWSGLAGVTNPIKFLTDYDQEYTKQTFKTINFLEYEPVKNLVLRSTGSLNYFTSKNKSYLPSDVGSGSQYNGSATISQSQVTTWLVENTAKYDISMLDHKIQLLAGFSAQSTNGESFSVTSRNFPIENLGYNNIGMGVDLTSPTSDKYKATIASFFGRVNYTFADKYLVTGTVRYDGSSNLGKAHKWGAFPSVALGWRASEETFLKDLNIFSDLKFRASYGITGNNSIGNYRSLLTYRSANTSVNSNQALGLQPASMPNPDLKWEQNQQLDLGLDLVIFDGRLSITADYYKKKSKDLLLNAPIPTYSGYSTYTTNIGDIQASGYELDLKGVILSGKVKWTSQFNISFPSTKVLKLSDTDFFFTGSIGHKADVFIVKEGQPLGSIYGYVYDGVNQNAEEATNLPQFGGSGGIGGPRYKDISGPDGVPDGVIDAKYDRKVIGNGLPDVFGGFTNRFEFKRFDLSFVVTYRFGNEMLNANKNFMIAAGNQNGPRAYIMNAWTPENPTNDFWRWGYQGIEYNNVSSWLVEDGSFVRLNNITLGYSFPVELTKKIGIQQCRMFVAGDKLLTFTNYSGYDPEVSYTSSMLTPGVDLSTYPNQKSFTMGLNITL